MTEQNEMEMGELKPLKPRQYAIYKGMGGKFGALRLNLRPAYSPDIKKEEGVIFLETAPAIGKNQYDWENQKIVFALSVGDVGKILLFLRNPSMFPKKNQAGQIIEDGGYELSVYHDNSSNNNLSKGAISSQLVLSKIPGRDSVFFSLNKKVQDKTLSTNLPVSPDEVLVMGTLLQAAIPAMLAW